MTQPIHPMLAKVVKATSGWVINIDGQGYRVQHGFTVFGKWHNTRNLALADLEASRARAAVQALMEPMQDMCDDATEVPIDDGRGGMTALNWEESALVLQAMLRPLVEGEGE